MKSRLPARIRANRRNASRSTGPRSEAGKARSARNSLRHGLAAASAGDDAWSDEPMQLASLFAGDVDLDQCSPEIYQLIEARFALNRIRSVRNALISELGSCLNSTEAVDGKTKELLHHLELLLRYEKPAFSRYLRR